jgi:hypothetical protein
MSLTVGFGSSAVMPSVRYGCWVKAQLMCHIDVAGEHASGGVAIRVTES